MQLRITVELGNEAMQTAADAAAAISRALLKQSASAVDPLNQHECGTVRDLNGNTVGEWSVD